MFPFLGSFCVFDAFLNAHQLVNGDLLCASTALSGILDKTVFHQMLQAGLDGFFIQFCRLGKRRN